MTSGTTTNFRNKQVVENPAADTDSEDEDDSGFGFADIDEDSISASEDLSISASEDLGSEDLASETSEGFDEPDWTTEFTAPDESDDDEEEDGTGFGFADGEDDEELTLPAFSGWGTFTGMLETIVEGEEEEEEEEEEPEEEDDFVLNLGIRLQGVLTNSEPTVIKSKKETLINKDPELIKRGWLRLFVLPNGKRPPRRPKWKEKWCVLENGQLRFQSSCNADIDPKQIKAIEMSHFKEFYEDKKSGDTQTRFVMETFGKSTYYFQCIDAIDCKEWLSILFESKMQLSSRSREGTPKVKRKLHGELKPSPLSQ